MPLPTETQNTPPVEGGGTSSVLGGEGGTTTPPIDSEAPWRGEDTWKIGEGEAAKDWFDLIPEEKVREGIKAKGYKNPAELAVAYSNLMAKQRNPEGNVNIPGEDATPEDVKAFNTAFGVPESADLYDLASAEGVEQNEDLVGFMRSTAHKLGMNQTQAKGFIQEWDTFTANLAKEQSEEAEANVASVKEQYGEELPKIQAAGQRAVKALGLSDATIAALDASIGTGAVVELLAKLGGKGGEAAFKAAGAGGGDADGTANLTPAQAQEKINDLMGDDKFQAKYQDKNAPGHEDAVKRMERLFARV